MAAEEVFLGRQPILDRDERLFAYELLFRPGYANVSNVIDDLHATASVIRLAFGQMGVRAVLGPHLGFINVSAAMLHSDWIELLPREQIVLELLETVVVTDDVVRRCRELKACGFRIALDDFVFTEAHVPLLDLADVVKIDLLLHDPSELNGIMQRLRHWPVKLLAEKVDSEEQAEHCKALGFDLFQGYYFARPSVLSARPPVGAALPLLELLRCVLGGAALPEIEQALNRVSGLTTRLLALVNSGARGEGGGIVSLAEAASVLGSRDLRRWLQLLPFAAQSDVPDPSPLMQLAAGRARLMEILAVRESAAPGFADAAFTTGILSLLDVLLHLPRDEVIGRLCVAERVAAALMRHEGALGRLLSLAEYVEQADQIGAARVLQRCRHISLNALTRAELESMAWVNATMGEAH